MRADARPRPLSLPEAVERLLAPDAAEQFSPVAGDPLLAVDLCAGDCTLDAEQTRRVQSALAGLSAGGGADTPDEIPTAIVVDAVEVQPESVALGLAQTVPEGGCIPFDDLANGVRQRFQRVVPGSEPVAALCETTAFLIISLIFTTLNSMVFPT